MKEIFEHIKGVEWDWFNVPKTARMKLDFIGSNVWYSSTQFWSLAELLANQSWCKAVWGEKKQPVFRWEYYSTISFQILQQEGEEACLKFIKETLTP